MTRMYQTIVLFWKSSWKIMSLMLPVKTIVVSLQLFETIRTDTDLHFFLKSYSALNFFSNDVLHDIVWSEKVFDEQRGHFDIWYAIFKITISKIFPFNFSRFPVISFSVWNVLLSSLRSSLNYQLFPWKEKLFLNKCFQQYSTAKSSFERNKLISFFFFRTHFPKNRKQHLTLFLLGEVNTSAEPERNKFHRDKIKA